MTRTRSALILLTGAVLLLGALNAAVFHALTREEARTLTVSFLDVGQGDAIYIEGPTGIEVLIDGGRDRSVLRRLPSAMGFFDRSLDLMIATHPDADHIGGLSDILARYRVGYFLEPGVKNDTSATHRLRERVGREKGMGTHVARRGERIHLGDGAYADVLYPDRDVSNDETNAGSIVLRVVYGDTSFMLTGDAPSDVERYLIGLDGGSLRSDVLKAGHHGSRTSTASEWLAAVTPTLVVISAGKDNSYGHPHEEVLERAAIAGARVVSTMGSGTLTFRSDGASITQE